MNIKLAQGDETRTSPHGTSVEHERMFVKKRGAEIHGERGRERERERESGSMWHRRWTWINLLESNKLKAGRVG